MDDCSIYLINRFLRKKSDLARQESRLIKRLNDQHGIKIKVIRCNNVGEHRKMKEACVELGLGKKFEYTAVVTLQQNGKIERQFASLYGRVRLIMIDAGLKEDLR